MQVSFVFFASALLLNEGARNSVNLWIACDGVMRDIFNLRYELSY